MSKKKPYHPDFDPRAEPLVRACVKGNLSRVRQLVNQGVPVNAIGSADDGYYAIHAAAEGGHDKIISYLLSVGAKIDPRTAAMYEQHDDTPLLIAAKEKKVKTVRHLVSARANINAHSATHNTALGWAIQFGNRELLDYLLANGAEVDKRHLRLAALRNDTTIIKELIARGLKLQDGDDPKYGSLLYCAIGGDQFEMVKFLIERGADINQASGPFAATPLIQACSTRKWKIANYLVERGADPNLGSKHKAYSLNYAAWRGGHDTARRLIKAGAKLDTVDFEGRTPLEWAVENRDIAMFQLLVKHGAKIPKKLFATITRRFGKSILK